MKNPFNPGSGVPPPYLAGREEHLDRFKQNSWKHRRWTHRNLLDV